MRYIKQFYNNGIALQLKQEAIMISESMNKLGFRKSSIKPPSQISPPPRSLKSPPFSGEES